MQHLTKLQLVILALDTETFMEERYAAAAELQRRTDDFPPDEELEYDDFRRLKYHPKIHWNKEPLTDQQKIYLCKYHNQDGLRAVSYVLGKPETSLNEQLRRMERNGSYWWYRQAEFEGFKQDEWRVTG